MGSVEKIGFVAKIESRDEISVVDAVADTLTPAVNHLINGAFPDVIATVFHHLLGQDVA